MAGFTSEEHRMIAAATKAARNTAARASRVRVSETVILQATDPAGKAYTVALSQKENWRAYLVWADRKTNALTCGCFQFTWRKVCAHVEAFAELTPGVVPGAPPPIPARRR